MNKEVIMKLWKLLPVLLLSTSLSCLTQGEIEEADVYKTPYAERIKMAEERFFIVFLRVSSPAPLESM